MLEFSKIENLTLWYVLGVRKVKSVYSQFFFFFFLAVDKYLTEKVYCFICQVKYLRIKEFN